MSQTRTFQKHILPIFGARPVLDLGCALGEHLRLCPPGSVGIDLSHAFLRQAAADGASGIAANLNHALPVRCGAFRAALCSHVLEHVDSPVTLLRECNRVLGDGGVLALALPREAALVELMDGYYRDHPYHLYSFTPRCIRHLLTRTGFQPSALFLDRPRILEPLEPLLERLPHALTTPLSHSYWIVSHKRTGDLAGSEAGSDNTELERRWLGA